MPRHLPSEGRMRGWVALGRSYVRVGIEDADHRVNVVKVRDQGAQLVLDVLYAAGKLAARLSMSPATVLGRSDITKARLMLGGE